MTIKTREELKSAVETIKHVCQDISNKHVVKSAPHLFYWLDGEGATIVEDSRTGAQYMAATSEDMRQLVADLSVNDLHVPLGDAVKKLTNFFGLRRCGACAERQARLNSMVRRLHR